jgi:3-oxoacyl-[acyl-carrier protein] reductase
MAGPALAPPPGAAIAVVGATGGIGRALVAALDAAGCRVVAMDLPGPLQDAPDDWSGDIARVPLDATDPGAVEAAFAHVSGTVPALDGLVHLAGFTRTRTPAVEVEPADWREVIEGNLDSAYLCLRSAAPLLRRGRAPSVVLTSSGLALKSTPGYGSYAAAKAGVLALMRATATELAPDVRVNAVAPSAVETPFLTGGTGRPVRAVGFDREAYLKTVPLGRMAQAEDVVGPILFLLGPASGYVTGQTLHVNGGLLMP